MYHLIWQLHLLSFGTTSARCYFPIFCLIVMIALVTMLTSSRDSCMRSQSLVWGIISYSAMRTYHLCVSSNSSSTIFSLW